VLSWQEAYEARDYHRQGLSMLIQKHHNPYREDETASLSNKTFSAAWTATGKNYGWFYGDP